MTEKHHVGDAQLRELLHLISHDLRNPLAAIVTNLEFAKRLLSRISVDQDLAESVEDSVTACDVLRRIVANFDVIVKGRDIGVTLQEIDVGDAVREVARRCKDRADQGGLEIVVLGAETGIRTMLDRILFSLAIENLISNGIQHGPRGSQIRISLTQNDGTIDIRFADDGSAIPEAARDLAVSAEGHSPSGRTDETRYGRGLGLLAARAAAAACGCTLHIGGTTSNVFTLSASRLPTI